MIEVGVYFCLVFWWPGWGELYCWYGVIPYEVLGYSRHIIRLNSDHIWPYHTTGHTLHASGAIKDGFGTGSNVEQTLITPPPISTHHGARDSIFEVPSTMAIALIISHTQDSSKGQNIENIASQGRRTWLAPNSTTISEYRSSLKLGIAASPLPLKRIGPRAVEQYDPGIGEGDWLRPRPRTS
jgi:hypothetical protein